MTELQEKVLVLLKEIDSLCRENDIEFYLAAGTALGAVRHRGFIPWDDDADIYMTKANWLKFFALREKLPDDRALITAEADYSCGYEVVRYMDISTTRLYRYHCANPQPGGVALDILILDPVPGSAEKVKEHVIALTEYGNMLIRAATHSSRCPYKTHYFRYWILSKLIGRKKMLDILRKRAFKYEEEPGCYYIQRDPIVPHVWSREIFGKPQYVPFEDTMMPIAEHPYEQLCIAFNEDWMYVPETVEREEHIKALNLNMSYKNAFGEYLQLVDLKKVDKLYSVRQRKCNMIGDLNKQQMWEKLKLVAAKAKLAYKKKGVTIEELYRRLQEGDYEYLDEYFSEYKVLQGSKKMIGGCAVKDWLRSQAPFYIDISDEFLYVFLRNMMHKDGCLSMVNRILMAREQWGTSSEQISELRDLVEKIKAALSLTGQGRYGEAAGMVALLQEKYPENIYLKRINYLKAFEEAEQTGDFEYLRKNLEDQERDDVLSLILAELYWREHIEERAIHIYRRIAEGSTNGPVLLHIRNRLMEYGENLTGEAVEALAFSRQRLGEFINLEELSEEDESDENSENTEGSLEEGQQ